MSDTPLVTVIIPTYNRAELVNAAVESALAQSYLRREIIVVDDGSTDDTQARLRTFGGRIRVIYQRNAGPSAARNAGVEASSGEMVAFLDSDDRWLPHKLARQIEVLEAAGKEVECCIANMTLCFNDGRRGTSFVSAEIGSQHSAGIWLNPAEVLATRFLMFNQAAVIRRAAFQQLGGFDERLRVLEDYDLALRLAVRGPWAFVSEPLVEWKQSQDSLSHILKQSSVTHESWGRILEDFVEKIPTSQAFEKVRNLSRAASNQSKRELRARRLSDSGVFWKRAAGNTYLQIQRACTIAKRHSPWYPRMETASLGECRSDDGSLSKDSWPAAESRETPSEATEVGKAVARNQI